MAEFIIFVATVLGSIAILVFYGFRDFNFGKDSDLISLLTADKRIFLFAVINALDVFLYLPPYFSLLDVGDKIVEGISAILVILLGATIMLWLIYGVMKLFGRSPAEGEDEAAFVLARKNTAFWICIAIAGVDTARMLLMD